MDHARFDLENRQDDEGEVVICRNIYNLARVCGIFCIMTFCIDVTAHHRFLEPASVPFGTNRNVEIIILLLFCCNIRRRITLSSGFIEEKSNDNTAGFIFNGGDASCIYKIIRLRQSQLFSTGVAGAIIVYVRAVLWIKVAGDGIADAKTGGVLDDDPGKHQARKLDDAYEHQ